MKRGSRLMFQVKQKNRFVFVSYLFYSDCPQKPLICNQVKLKVLCVLICVSLI